MSPLLARKFNILLADDDKDDCLLFDEALQGLDLKTSLTIVHDGEQLIQLLTKPPSINQGKSKNIYDVLFLDLNMPRKNGSACLKEIKRNINLKALPVIIFSTSYDPSVAEQLYKSGAQHYICKPACFSELKNVIQEALILISEEHKSQPYEEVFVLRSSKKANLL
jgi:CheY-like chemotaxis protein